MPQQIAGLASLIAIMTAAVGAAAQTGAPEPLGLELGVRGGYGLPFGNGSAGQPFDQMVDGAIPFALDVGYRVRPYLYFGALVSYAPLRLDKVGLGCNREIVDGPGDCSGSALRIAADAQFRAWLGRHLTGWVAAGFGIERFTVDYTSGCMGGPFSVVVDGLELGHLEVGGGGRVARGLIVGPFTSVSVGQLRSAAQVSTGTPPGCHGASADIPDKAIHGWLTLGLRATFTVP